MKRLTAIFLVIACAFSMTLLGCSASSEEGEEEKSAGENGYVYVYNYGTYIDPDLIDEFEEETGITVIYDTFDTNEEMYPVIANGSVSYDVVGAGDYMVEKMIENDLLQPLNHDNLSNMEYINDTCKEFAEDYDPGFTYSVPYTWGTVGILYNSRNIPDGEITKWSDLWDEKYYDNIMMMDSIRDTMMIPLKIAGNSCNTEVRSEVEAACEMLKQQKSLVYKYATDAIRDFLLNESADIGVIYSGEATYCQEDDPDMHYVVPEEGTNIWFDTWTIPKNAENVTNAEIFINYMMRPDVSFRTYEYLHYSTPCQAAYDMIAEEYPEDLENPALFPSEEIIKRCETYHYLGEEADKMYNDYWKEFKTY